MTTRDLKPNQLSSNINRSIIDISKYFNLMIEAVDDYIAKITTSCKQTNHDLLIQRLSIQLNDIKKSLVSLKIYSTNDNLSQQDQTIVVNLYQRLYVKYSQRVKIVRNLIMSQCQTSEPIQTSTKENKHLLPVEDVKFQLLSVVDSEIERIESRHLEITQLSRDMAQLNQMFAELNTLVEIQGEDINQIENNVEMTTTHVNQAEVELVTANIYQNAVSKLKLKTMGIVGTMIMTLGLIYGLTK